MGKGLEERADYVASWHYYERGNAERNKTSTYKAEAAADCVERIKQTFTPEAFAARQGWGLAGPAPIFVLGLPRSGSTLVEQILASHSLVEGTQELTELGRYMEELCGRDPSTGFLPTSPWPVPRSQSKVAGVSVTGDNWGQRQLVSAISLPG